MENYAVYRFLFCPNTGMCDRCVLSLIAEKCSENKCTVMFQAVIKTLLIVPTDAHYYKIVEMLKYEDRSESKERFTIQRYLLTIGKKQNMQVLSHTFTYFST